MSDVSASIAQPMRLMSRRSSRSELDRCSPEKRLLDQPRNHRGQLELNVPLRTARRAFHEILPADLDLHGKSPEPHDLPNGCAEWNRPLLPARRLPVSEDV